MKLVLLRSITHGEELITSLTFREELVAGDFRGIRLQDLDLPENLLKIAGRLTGQTDAALAKMSIPDLLKVAEIVASFFGSGPKAPTTP